MIQMLVRWHRDGPLNSAFKLHQYRVRDYLWSVSSDVKLSITSLAVLITSSLFISTLRFVTSHLS